MNIDNFSDEDVRLFLDEISSLSGDSVDQTSESSDSDKPARKKRGRPRKIVTDVVVSIPRTRILRQDIRRSYPNMMLNIFNSADIAALFGFLDTFCARNVNQTTFFHRKALNLVLTEQRSGLDDLARFWCANFQFIPDAVLHQTSCYLDMSPEHNGNRIVAKYNGKATNIYDIEFPGFSSTMPRATIVQLPNAALTVGKKRKLNDSDSSVEEHLPCISQMRSIMNYVNGALQKLPLREIPTTMDTEFILVLNVNDDKMITNVEVIGSHL